MVAEFSINAGGDRHRSRLLRLPCARSSHTPLLESCDRPRRHPAPSFLWTLPSCFNCFSLPGLPALSLEHRESVTPCLKLLLSVPRLAISLKVARWRSCASTSFVFYLSLVDTNPEVSFVMFCVCFCFKKGGVNPAPVTLSWLEDEVMEQAQFQQASSTMEKRSRG